MQGSCFSKAEWGCYYVCLGGGANRAEATCLSHYVKRLEKLVSKIENDSTRCPVDMVVLYTPHTLIFLHQNRLAIIPPGQSSLNKERNMGHGARVVFNPDLAFNSREQQQ